MKKGLIIITLLCLIQVTPFVGTTHAAGTSLSEMMQSHIDKMKRTKPGIYKRMLKEAGGTVVNCLSCHRDFGKKNSAFSPKFPR